MQCHLALLSSGLVLYRFESANLSRDAPLENLLFDWNFALYTKKDQVGHDNAIVVRGVSAYALLNFANRRQYRDWKRVLTEGIKQNGWEKAPRFHSFAREKNVADYKEVDGGVAADLLSPAGARSAGQRTVRYTVTDDQDREEPAAISPPMRSPNFVPRARWMVDGVTTFRAIAHHISRARTEVYITGWQITPDLHLLRPAHRYPNFQLRKLLAAKARQGVKIFVCVYNAQYPLDLGHDYCKEALESEHSNIRVLLHPGNLTGRARDKRDMNSLLWSHHEKSVIIDHGRVAIMGGLDLAYIRCDDADHRLDDVPDADGETFFKGLDYCNSRAKNPEDKTDFSAGHVDAENREQTARMPWHDVSVVVYGAPAQDLARHFVQRWNHDRYSQEITPEFLVNYPVLVHRPTEDGDLEGMIDPQLDAEMYGGGELTVETEASDKLQNPQQASSRMEVNIQVCRSCSSWSAGNRYITERSIQEAYISLIRSAREQIYIENQFFVSGMTDDTEVGNRILQALADRIIEAHETQTPIRIMVIVPLFPNMPGVLKKGGVHSMMAILSYQYRSFSHLNAKLKEAGISDTSEYIRFFSIRKHGILSSRPVTEMIYVHTKLMIVDDEWTIIGSANINDRSMLGDRDTELAVIIQDTQFIETPAGLAGSFAYSLRTNLFSEHLGLSLDEVQEHYSRIDEVAWKKLFDISERNTALFETVFQCVPSDTVRNWDELDRMRAEKDSACRKLAAACVSSKKTPYATTPDAFRFPNSEEGRMLAENVKGRLVRCPTRFLGDEENLYPSGVFRLAPAKIFI